MREIKFRAWDKKNKVMIYLHNADEIIEQFEEKDYLYGLEEIYPWSDIDFLNGIYILHEKYKDRLVVMQYTGLKDKNGREIYEGDIVKIIYSTSRMNIPEIILEEVKFVDGAFMPFYWLREDEEYDIDYLINITKDIQVVGNVFENSELPKDKNNN